MIASRVVFSSGSHGAKVVTLSLCKANMTAVSLRAHSVNAVSRSLALVTTRADLRLEKDATSSTPRVVEPSGKPLAILLPWLMSKSAHVHKYATFYLDQGFDVLTVRVTPWQLLWPANGSQVVAAELLEFLRSNYTSEPLMLHGFSVGGYLWGEVCGKALENGSLYQSVLDRVVGQVWDSVADITEIPIGVSRAVFPRNPALQAVVHGYLKYHMRAFHDVATKHYIRSSQMFHTNLVRAPALFLVSKADPVGSEESNRRVHDSWASRGVQTYWKCWEKSPHVGHYRKYPKEYAAELFEFFNMLQLVQNPDKIRAKM